MSNIKRFPLDGNSFGSTNFPMDCGHCFRNIINSGAFSFIPKPCHLLDVKPSTNFFVYYEHNRYDNSLESRYIFIHIIILVIKSNSNEKLHLCCAMTFNQGHDRELNCIHLSFLFLSIPSIQLMCEEMIPKP